MSFGEEKKHSVQAGRKSALVPMTLYDLNESCLDEDFDVPANLSDAQAKEICQALLRGPAQPCFVVGVICKRNVRSPAIGGDLRFEKYFKLWDSGESALFRHNSNLSARAAVRSDGMIYHTERRLPREKVLARRLFFCLFHCEAYRVKTLGATC